MCLRKYPYHNIIGKKHNSMRLLKAFPIEPFTADIQIIPIIKSSVYSSFFTRISNISYQFIYSLIELPFSTFWKHSNFPIVRLCSLGFSYTILLLCFFLLLASFLPPLFISSDKLKLLHIIIMKWMAFLSTITTNGLYKNLSFGYFILLCIPFLIIFFLFFVFHIVLVLLCFTFALLQYYFSFSVSSSCFLCIVFSLCFFYYYFFFFISIPYCHFLCIVFLFLFSLAS